ncbi:SDR family NAD(P)-dependent oxidoreductase [Stenotrophomonas sp. LGBM10]|uniref:SDR family NAD(P)-dependent oxidoreductase n=1 Tax=Stenotrophomonas sp. LGBM10 TaxID=3390038 RepID=UPI00398B8551
MNGILAPEVLVLGGTGNVGQGIVAALLEAGSPVLVVGRDPGRLAALRDQFADEPALETLLGSVADDGSARTLAERIAARPRPLAAVVASLGAPLRLGRLIDQPSSWLMERIERDLVPHVNAAHHLVPLLAQRAPGARYVVIGSPCGLRPWSGHGDASVSSAAIRMFVQVLHEEAQGVGVRAQMLEVTHPVCTPGNAANACVEWPSALAVGRRVVSVLDGCRDMRPFLRCDTTDAALPKGLLRIDAPAVPWRNSLDMA